MALPAELHEAGIVQSGAIIVYDGAGRRTASYVAGTLWVGALEFPDDCSIDALDTTFLLPKNQMSATDAIQAASRFALWQHIVRGPNTKTRILTALDALGGEYEGVQHLLANVCAMSRERLLRQLRQLHEAGEIERYGGIRHVCRYVLPKESRGLFWNISPNQAANLSVNNLSVNKLLTMYSQQRRSQSDVDAALLAALRQYRLNTYQFAVYQFLLQEADDFNMIEATNKKIAASTRFHQQTVKDALERLERLELLTYTQNDNRRRLVKVLYPVKNFKFSPPRGVSGSSPAPSQLANSLFETSTGEI